MAYSNKNNKSPSLRREESANSLSEKERNQILRDLIEKNQALQQENKLLKKQLQLDNKFDTPMVADNNPKQRLNNKKIKKKVKGSYGVSTKNHATNQDILDDSRLFADLRTSSASNSSAQPSPKKSSKAPTVNILINSQLHTPKGRNSKPNLRADYNDDFFPYDDEINEDDEEDEDEDDQDDRDTLVSSTKGRMNHQKRNPVFFMNSPEPFGSSPTAYERFFLPANWTEVLFQECNHGTSSQVSSIINDKTIHNLEINCTTEVKFLGSTPLIVALKNNQIEGINIARQLLVAGADVNKQDNNGSSPLHHILNRSFAECETGLYMQVVHTIIEKSSRETIDLQNNNKNSALLLAVLNSSNTNKECFEQIVLALLQRGASVNAKESYNATALILAAKGSYNAVCTCLQFGANVRDIDASGNSALHYAAIKGHHDICEILAARGADFSSQNDLGQTALDVTQDPKIRKLLEDYYPRSKSWKCLENQMDIISSEMVLGEGKFAVCSKGKLYGTPVAIKRFKKGCIRSQFESEVGLMSDIKHPNVVLFLGAYYQEEDFCIITEYLQNGNLRNYLYFHDVTRELILKFASTTARGMAWLHSRKPAVLHRDLHGNNILVADDLSCKVADFGLSQIEVLSSYNEDNVFYQRIHPPELRKNPTEKYSTNSDTYQYGLVVYEMLHRGNKANPNVDFLNEPPTDPNNEDLHELMKRCCAELPDDRPPFLQIIEEIDQMQFSPPPGNSLQLSTDELGYIKEE